MYPYHTGGCSRPSMDRLFLMGGEVSLLRFTTGYLGVGCRAFGFGGGKPPSPAPLGVFMKPGPLGPTVDLIAASHNLPPSGSLAGQENRRGEVGLLRQGSTDILPCQENPQFQFLVTGESR